MQRLSTREAMRRADQWNIEQGTTGLELMERAAEAVAAALRARSTPEDDIAFLCGRGNNGGDGMAAARILAAAGWKRLAVYLWGDPTALRGDAAVQRDRLQEVGLTLQPAAEWQPKQEAWIVDALFGTGLDRDLGPAEQALVQRINQAGAKVLAADLPSGIDADTGQIRGAAVKADETVTLARKKIGMALEPARTWCGRVRTADIGLKEETPSLQEETIISLEVRDIETALPKRTAYSHKGTYGRLLVLAGSETMTGAAILCAGAAYRAGTGLVQVILPRAAALPLQCTLPEAVVTLYEQGEEPHLAMPERASALLAGPGLGQGPAAEAWLRYLLQHFPIDKPVILDADALNLIAQREELAALVRERGGRVILTPHLAEGARLLHTTTAEVLKDRPAAARELARRYQACVILKDAASLIAAPDGRLCINTTGNHGMATAGSGDVLAGLTAGLAAQGAGVWEAASLGAWLHGNAGDRAAEEVGYYALMASDISRHIYLG